MSDLILREEAKAAIRAKFDSVVDRVEINEVLNAVPAIDAAPVRHGRWLFDPNAHDYNLGGWVCSLCNGINCMIPTYIKVDDMVVVTHEQINPYGFSGAQYCPHCGAKMEAQAGKEG